VEKFFCSFCSVFELLMSLLVPAGWLENHPWENEQKNAAFRRLSPFTPA
jgi:hypothetical protein